MAFFTSGTNAAGTLRDLIPVLSKLGITSILWVAKTLSRGKLTPSI
jgi:hypothetical protein